MLHSNLKRDYQLEGAEAETEDSCEEVKCANPVEPDVDDEDYSVVDTDAASDSSGYTTQRDSDSSGSEVDLNKAPLPLKKARATGVTVPGTGGTAPGTGDAVSSKGGAPNPGDQGGNFGSTMSHNGYFYLRGSKKDLKVHIIGTGGRSTRL